MSWWRTEATTARSTGDSGGTFSGIVSSPSTTLNVFKIGSATEILSGTNTYSGSTNIGNGAIQLSGGANRLPIGTAVMAATGLLYLAILTAFGTDLVARAILA